MAVLTNGDIVTRAYRMLGTFGIGEAVTADHMAEGLKTLESVIMTLPGWDGWSYREINTNYAAGEDESITFFGDGTVAVTLPQMVYADPFVYFSGGGLILRSGEYYKAPRDGARVRVSAQMGDTHVYYAYRADTGKWLPVRGLEVGGIVPLNAASHNDLSAILAVALAPMTGDAVSGEVQNAYNMGMSRMSARYNTRQEPRSEDNAASRSADWF